MGSQEEIVGIWAFVPTPPGQWGRHDAFRRGKKRLKVGDLVAVLLKPFSCILL